MWEMRQRTKVKISKASCICCYGMNKEFIKRKIMHGEHRIDFIMKYLNSSLTIKEDHNGLVIDEKMLRESINI